ncbi:hypothetical protein [Sediminimonas qiaohouensis]|uniref:hypothetical protein n=1 Tax=Sediminimonas qiaohouensis TaxID=552061 RepID=UPI0012ED9A19|nr:hypothetical protein [Sediminimonas qiaohouensis]
MSETTITQLSDPSGFFVCDAEQQDRSAMTVGVRGSIRSVRRVFVTAAIPRGPKMLDPGASSGNAAVKRQAIWEMSYQTNIPAW